MYLTKTNGVKYFMLYDPIEKEFVMTIWMRKPIYHNKASLKRELKSFLQVLENTISADKKEVEMWKNSEQHYHKNWYRDYLEAITTKPIADRLEIVEVEMEIK